MLLQIGFSLLVMSYPYYSNHTEQHDCETGKSDVTADWYTWRQRTYVMPYDLGVEPAPLPPLTTGESIMSLVVERTAVMGRSAERSEDSHKRKEVSELVLATCWRTSCSKWGSSLTNSLEV